MAKAMGSYKTWKLDSNGLSLEIRSLEASSHLLSNQELKVGGAASPSYTEESSGDSLKSKCPGYALDQLTPSPQEWEPGTGYLSEVPS